jgi:predicted transposase YdaD
MRKFRISSTFEERVKTHWKEYLTRGEQIGEQRGKQIGEQKAEERVLALMDEGYTFEQLREFLLQETAKRQAAPLTQ